MKDCAARAGKSLRTGARAEPARLQPGGSWQVIKPASGPTLSSVSAPLMRVRAVGHEIFEDEAAVAPLQRSAAAPACNFAVWGERVGFNPNHLVMCAAVRTVERSHRMFRHARDLGLNIAICR